MTRTTTQFTYNTQPHSAPRPGATADHNVALTLMSDPRVVRGNTHSLARKIAKDRTSGTAELTTATAEPVDVKLRSTSQQQPNQPYYNFASKPFALEGTDLTQFLVDQSENEVVPTKVCDTQTDEFTELPPAQPYVPRKTGVDNSTQIEDVNELFNFDEESVPLVEVIVRKTLEQALVEINHEAELVALEQQAATYEAQRHLEMEWMKQQEENIAQEQRRVRGMVEQMQERLRHARDVKLKVAGLQMARQILPHTFERITHRWKRPEQKEIEDSALPDAVARASLQSKAYNQSVQVVDELLQDAVTRFDDVPMPTSRPSTQLRKLSVRLLRTVQERIPTSTIEGEEPSEPEMRDVQVVAAVLTLGIEQNDSIVSLESKLRRLLFSLRYPNAGATAASAPSEGDNNEEDAKAEDAPPPVVNNWYPVQVPLYDALARPVAEWYESQQLPSIPVARDALLSYFPLAIDNVTVDFVLPQT